MKLSRKTLKYKETDREYQIHTIKGVERDDDKNGWEIQIEDNCYLFIPKIKNHKPMIGDLTRFYGKGEGYTIRGVDVGNVTYYYRTPKQQENLHNKEFNTPKNQTQEDKNNSTYRNQNGCHNCNCCFIKEEYENENEYYCNINKSKRPICGSIYMKESFSKKHANKNLFNKRYQKWEKWTKGKKVNPWGICDEWGKQIISQPE